MKTCLAVLLLMTLVSSTTTLVAREVVVAEPSPAPTCWDPEVKRCCSVATLPAPAQCSVDGISWTCAPVITSNPLVLTFKQAELGYEGKENDGTKTCKFIKRVCGASPLSCLNDLADTATCQNEKSVGNLCESQP